MDNPSLRLEQVLDDFEEAWQAGENPPDLADFVNLVPLEIQPRVLAELIPVDLEYRWRRFHNAQSTDEIAGLPARPHLQDYADRFGELLPADRFPPELVAEEDRVLKRFATEVPFDQVNSVCETFLARQDGKSTPNFEECLSQVPTLAQPTLIRNLLHHEMESRRNLGEMPQAQDYVDRFPHLTTVIHQAFDETPNKLPGLSMASTSPTPAHRTPAAPLLGEYRLLRELGRGGMGCVYEAVHLQHQHRVALKLLPQVDGPSLHRFKQEFRLATELNHPNLVGLHTLQAEGNQWFLTMDLVEGTDFLSYIRPKGQLDVTRLRSGLAQVVRGVQALHSRHIVHRDLKPSNVMVTPSGQVRVLDFGLAVQLQPDNMSAFEEAGGTPAYMAPEQINYNATTGASDWYALGVMLYQTLTGQLPFSGPFSQLLAAKQRNDPPAITGDVPDDLVSLCHRLLCPVPGGRPGDTEILDVLCPDEADSSTFQWSERTDRLFGRESHLELLGQAFEVFEKQTNPHTIFISGRSGEGKTILAEQFLSRFRRDPTYTVLSGRCYDRESVPFKALDTVIDALCNHLQTLPTAEVRSLLTRDVSVLADLFPAMNRVEEIAQLPDLAIEDLEIERVRKLAADALREIFRRLSRTTTIVCFVDDLQWGDSESAELLRGVLGTDDSPHLLFLGTYRSDEADDSRFLSTWHATTGKEENGVFTECHLDPLSIEECVELVVNIVGTDDDLLRTQAREMAEETGRNPFLLAELASCYELETRSVHSLRMEDVVQRKLANLPQDARRVLEVVAVAGHAMPLDEAAQTTGHGSVPLSTITRMRTEHLLRLVGDERDFTLDTYHDRIRETILREMDDLTRRGLHVLLGDVIETKVAALSPSGESGQAPANPRVYDLAYHFYEGGDPRAFQYQVKAGEAALSAFAMENALEYLNRAKSILPKDADSRSRFTLWERLGEACGRTRRFQEGLVAFENARPHASDEFERAKVDEGLGEIYQWMGEYPLAISHFDSALKEVRYSRPKWLPRILLETTWYFTLCLFPFLVRPFKSPNKRSRAAYASRILHRIAQVYLPIGNAPRYSHACVKLSVAALRTNDPDSIVPAFAKVGFNCAAFSMGFLHSWMIRKALSYAETTQDIRTKSVANAYLSTARYCLGHLDGLENSLQESIDSTALIGDIWLTMALHHNLRHTYSVYGQSQKELAEAEEEKRLGEIGSDQNTICWGLYGMAYAKARMGLLAEAHQHIQDGYRAIENLDVHLSRAILTDHYGFVLIQSSNYESAIIVLEQAIRLVEKNAIFMDYCIRCYPTLIECILGPNWNEQKRSKELGRAKRLSHKARFFAWRFHNLRPMTMRIMGRLSHARGRKKKAIRYFEKSIDSARRLGAEYDLARALLDLASVSDQEKSAQLRREAVSILNRIKAVIPYAERWQLGGLDAEACVAPDLRDFFLTN